MIDLVRRIAALERAAAGLRADVARAEARAARAEHAARLADAGAVVSGSGGGGSIRLGRSTTILSAGSATAPGSGTVQPLVFDPGSGSYVSDGPTVTAHNAGVSISSGVLGLWFKDGSGSVWFTPEACG